jgi:hypothetical protein
LIVVSASRPSLSRFWTFYNDRNKTSKSGCSEPKAHGAREFDKAAALEAAMDCFWRRGCAAASMWASLTVSMGISGPGLCCLAEIEAFFSRSTTARAGPVRGHRVASARDAP